MTKCINNQSHCLFFRRLKAAIPCRKCAGVAYCSTFCRDEAEDSHHKYECEFHDLLTGLGCSQVARLALRMITIKPFQFFLNLKPKLASLPGSDNTSEDESDYLRVYNLVGLEEKRWPEENLIRATLAIVLLSILRASGYFDIKKSSTSGDSFSPNEIFFGSLLLKHLQILQFNAHEVYEIIRGSKSTLKPSKNVVIGLAIYPTASYFNHSCHAGLARCFQGKEMILRCLHPIKRGQEVSENYGHAFYFKSKSDRKKELNARYWFECGCVACIENWPLLDKLPKKEGANNVEKSAQIKLCEKGVNSMNQAKIEDALTHFKIFANHYYQEGGSVSKMCQELVRAEDKVRTCISNLGNVVFTDDLVHAGLDKK